MRCCPLWVSLVCFIALTACSSRPVPPPPSGAAHFWSEKDGWYKVTADGTANCLPWDFSGKTGIHSTQHNTQQAASLYLHWQEFQDSYDLDLSGPLGTGSAHLHGNNSQVQLIDAHGLLHTAASPEQLLLDSLGVSAPVSQMRQWMHGRATTPQALVHSNALGQMATLQEGAYLVNYEAYAPEAKLVLPHRMRISAPDFTMIIAIHQWKIPDTCLPMRP